MFKELTFNVVVNACTNEVFISRPKEPEYKVYLNERFEKVIQFDSNVDYWDAFKYKGKEYDINLDYYDEEVGLMVAIYEVDERALKDGQHYELQHKVKLKVVTNKTQWDKYTIPK